MAKKKADKIPALPKERLRWGIGEWYGKSFAKLTPGERVAFAKIQTEPATPPEVRQCPFLTGYKGSWQRCGKKGGVCSIRLYREDGHTKAVSVSLEPESGFRATCPNRFVEAGEIFKWVGAVLLGAENPTVLGEIGFLEAPPLPGEIPDTEKNKVGRIDNVLFIPDSEPLKWCALEIQGVYFQGDGMKDDFIALSQHLGDGMAFPAGRRGPDDRSSGPKRLMPQLQIKVPSLRRWGKKVAVVVDEGFFGAMASMREVPDVSNSDVVWFVVAFEEGESAANLIRRKVVYTTLESAVEGLTAGVPTTLRVFEERIGEKFQAEKKQQEKSLAKKAKAAAKKGTELLLGD